MTSEREEVIDFVAPYFEQSGILIGTCNLYLFLTIYIYVYSLFLSDFFFSLLCSMPNLSDTSCKL